MLLQLLQLNVQRLWDPPIVEEEFVRYVTPHVTALGMRSLMEQLTV